MEAMEAIEEIITIVWNAFADALIKAGMAVEVGEEKNDAE